MFSNACCVLSQCNTRLGLLYLLIREEATSALAVFLCGSAILVELEFGDISFCGGRKTGELGEKTLKQGDKLNPHTVWHLARIGPGPVS